MKRRTLSQLWGRVSHWNGPLVTLFGLAIAAFAGLLLIGLDWLDGLVFVGLGVFTVASFIEPLAGFGAALFLGPLRAYLATWVPAVPDQIGQLFLAAALGGWLVRGLVRRDIRIRSTPVLIALLGFVLAALLSLWDAVELPVYGLPELLKWVQVVLVVIFLSDHLTELNFLGLLGALLTSALFQVAVGFWQFALWEDPINPFPIDDTLHRAYGTFEQPNPYGGFLGIILPLTVGVVAVGAKRGLEGWLARRAGRPRTDPRSGRLRQFGYAGLYRVALFLAGGLIMSWSRGAWIAFVAGLLVMAAALPRRTRWGLVFAAVLVVAVVAAYLAGLIPASISERLADFPQYIQITDVRGVSVTEENFAVMERLAHWQAGLGMFRYNFWTGVGLGCYEPAYATYSLINWPYALGHAHNYYINLAAETGLIGLSAYLALWGVLFYQTWKVSRASRGFHRGLAIGLLGSWVHLSVHNVLDTLYVNNAPLHVAALMGLLVFL
ncbi:MAG: O-antigen ligase domain-containing protein, partial [Anaerolineales bacterium]